MKNEDIDFSDNPKVSPEMFARGVLRKNFKPTSPEPQVTLNLDQDVLDFFKMQGNDYQTKINQLLRAYMEEHQAK